MRQLYVNPDGRAFWAIVGTDEEKNLLELGFVADEGTGKREEGSGEAVVLKDFPSEKEPGEEDNAPAEEGAGNREEGIADAAPAESEAAAEVLPGSPVLSLSPDLPTEGPVPEAEPAAAVEESPHPNPLPEGEGDNAAPASEGEHAPFPASGFGGGEAE